jgi:hypothetical protein
VNLDRRQQWLAVLAATAVALWVGDRLVATPLARSWQARAARLAELRESVAKGSALLEREAGIRRTSAFMETNTLPAEVAAAETTLLRAFDRWSRDSRISLTSLKPQWRQSGEDHAVLECRVDAAGSLAALTRFLYEIESDPLALRIDLLELAGRDNDGQQLQLALQVSALQLPAPEP